MYKFSENSLKQINTCHSDLQRVLHEAIKVTDVDFGVSEGHRSVERQQELYAQGRTKAGAIVTHVDGVEKKSMHNYMPSKAFDIYAFVNGKASWAEKDLCYLGGVIMSTAKRLGIGLTWGGNWDGDGVIITDQGFEDLPHYQLK